MIDIAIIKDISGKVKYTTPINEGCVWKKELMKHDYLLLKFSLPELIDFRIGDYVEVPMGKYELLDVVYPSLNQSTGGYDYELDFHAYYWKWKNKIMLYNRQNSKEASWSLTRSAKDHLGIVLENLNALGYLYNGKKYEVNIGDSVDKIAKLISYNNTSLLDALNVIAENWECEWWVVNNQIHLGRCEYNTDLDFALGENVKSMSRSASNDNLATRIYAFGSTRNIPTNYRPSEGAVVEGVVQKRLMLPVGTPSVDAYPNMSPEQAVESVVVFDDIYPRMLGVMKEVTPKEYTDKIENEDGSTTEEKWNAYRFQDTKLTFSKEYVLPGQELRIVFTTGALNGMDFAVSFNPDDKKPVEEQIFEIIRNEDYGIPLPGKDMIPKNDDEYILYGFDAQLVSDQLIPAAEQELLERAQNYLEKFKVDPSVYDCQMNVIDLHEADMDLDLGTQVNLVNQTYFDVPRKSRIHGFEKQLDGSAVSYTVGYTSRYSRLANVEGQIKEITYNGNAYSNSGGGGVYVINQYDKTTPTDRNVFSALRALREHLSRKKDDTAAGHITFDQGLTSHDFTTLFKGIVKEYLSSETFIPGFLGEGFKIYDTASGWTAEFDNIVVRNAMTIYELLISKIRAVNGGLVVSPANGRVKSVDISETVPAYYELGIEGDMQFVTGDLVRCQITESNRSRSYWVEVKQVEGDRIRCLVSDFKDAVPAVGDDLVQFGNTTNTDRQGVLYLTASEDGKPRIHVLDGVDSTNLTGKNKTVLGSLDGITDAAFPAGLQPSGYGLYSDNAYLKGKFVLSSGKTVEQDVTDKVNAIEIGGRNLIPDSSMELGLKLWVNSHNADISYQEGIFDGGEMNQLYGSKCLFQTPIDTNNPDSYMVLNRTIQLKPNTSYTFSFYYVSAGAIIGHSSFSQLHNKNGDFTRYIGINNGENTDKKWKRVFSTFKTTDIETQITIRIGYVHTEGQSSWMAYDGFMLEEGNKVTAWTPALEDIDVAIDDIQIGGRNLLSDSINRWLDGSDYISQFSHFGKGKLIYRNDTSGFANAYLNRPSLNTETNVLMRGKTYTASIDVLCKGDYNGRLTFGFDSRIDHTTVIARQETKIEYKPYWQRVSSTIVVPDVDYTDRNPGCLIDFAFVDTNGLELEYKNIKIEEGNKATDWTPAPEDVQSSIDKVRTDYNADFVILDEKIESKVSQTDFNALGQQVADAESIITQLPDQITLAVQESEKYTDEKVDNIQVGGRNLVLDSRLHNRISGDSAGCTLNPIPDKFGEVTEVTRIYGSGEYQIIFDRKIPLNTTVTISIKYKDVNNGWFAIGDSNVNGSPIYTMLSPDFYSGKKDLGDGWYQLWATLKYNGDGAFGINTCSGIFRICQMKVEVGNIVTDWTPAPEDTEAITNDLTQRLTKAESEISLTPDKITMAVTETKQYADNVAVNAAKRTEITIDALGLDANKYYPVVIWMNATVPYTITVERNLHWEMGVPHWSTHGGGFSVICKWTSNGSGWGTIGIKRIIHIYETRFATVLPVGSIGQMNNSSNEYIYVRGGSKYNVLVEGATDVPIVLRPSGYSEYDQTIDVIDSVDQPIPDIDQRPTTETIKSQFEITTNGISLLGKQISLTGQVTFDSLASGAVGISKLDSTIIEGGYIKTNLINVDTLIAKKIDAATGTFNRISGISGRDEMLLTPTLIRFTGDYSSLFMGAETAPATTGGSLTLPIRLTVNRTVSNSANGNAGIYISIKGSTDYDDVLTSGNHALFIEQGDICGFRLRTRRLSTSQTLNAMDSIIMTVATSDITLTLPYSPQSGQMYFIRKCASGNVFVKPGSSSHKIKGNYNYTTTSMKIINGDLGLFIWDRVNSIWTCNLAYHF